GRQRTEIDLNPAELGRVKVRMELENGVMRVVLRAEHAATHDLLGRSLDQLRRDLMAQGVQIGHLEVRQPGDDQRRGRRDSPRDDEGDFADVMELDEPSSGATRTRRRHDGDVDLEA
ncbi:MAG: flagellar hook-length control protein FliK, partial [Myxococcales bacterium]|nr:flagellar hook-length control protein FliK [Myxococcales bacterium]